MDRQRAFFEHRQEDGVPFHALGAVVGEQVDAGRRSVALGLVASRELGQQLLRPSVRVARDDLVDDCQERVERGRPLARLAAGRHDPFPVAQLAAPQVEDGAREGAPADGQAGIADRPDGVAHVPSLVEALAANLVGDVGARERLLQGHELGIGPHQQRDLCRRDPVGHEPAHVCHDGGRLALVVGEPPDGRHGTRWSRRTQAFERPVAAISRLASSRISGVDR